jgi:RNA polymerase sigma factor (sigma-70 family)
MNEVQLINRAIKNNRTAQTELYGVYKSLWFSICLRYMRDRNEASDVLQEALIKIFTRMKQFDSNKGHFKSWSCRIVVNENLMFLRKQIPSFQAEELNEELLLQEVSETPIDRLSAEELTKLICALPEGYRTVFNLYVLDGYNHKEIAEMLGISEGTSKSQLFKARKLLQKELEVLI